VAIILKVLTYKGLPLPSELSVEIDQRGGTIGRKSGNNMVLPDAENFVSGHHAEIIYLGGDYFIRDTSKNGTYLSNSARNLNDAQAVLTNNEILRIGEYEILVEILTENSVNEAISIENIFSSPFADPFANEPKSVIDEPLSFSLPLSTAGIPFSERPPASPFHDHFAVPDVSPSQIEGKDIAEFLKGLDSLNAVEKPVVASREADDAISKSTSASFIPPSVNVSELDKHFEAMAPPTIEPPQPEPIYPNNKAAWRPQSEFGGIKAALNDDALMHKFLEGAGIKDHAFLPEEQWGDVMKATGQLFRNLIEGLMDVLRARAEMKSEFRVSVTTIRSFDNNPLKFNPDVESVLKLMLAPNNPAFINSNDAVNEAFKDIKYHQLAMTSGIQAALAEILHRFEPESFEKILGEGIVFQKKAKCWELYCEKYPELKTLAIEGFFGDEFAEAYEKQMRLFARR
jgi:type VI secretion system protein ImpI/type VI secretion system protein